MTAEPLTYTTRADFAGLIIDDVDTAPHPTLDFHGGLVMGCTVHGPGVWILSGVAMGEVRIHVERLDRPPSAPDAEWEDVVEVSCRPRAEHVFARGPEEYAPGPRFALNPAPDGWFRLRIHASRRDLEYDGVASGPHEQYLLQSWPAGPEPPTVLRTTSAIARRYGDGVPARPLGVSAGPSFLTPEEQARAEENLLRRGRRPSSGT